MLKIETNLDTSTWGDEIFKPLISELAVATNHPEQLICINASGNQNISFGGSNDPCSIVHFELIEQINEEKNSQYATIIFKHLKTKGIPNDRTLIMFTELKNENIAWNGSLLSQK